MKSWRRWLRILAALAPLQLLSACFGLSVATPQHTVIEKADLGADYQAFSNHFVFANYEAMRQSERKPLKIESHQGGERWTFSRAGGSRSGWLLGALVPIPWLSTQPAQDIYEVRQGEIVRLTRTHSHSHWRGGVYGCWVGGAHGGVFPVCGNITPLLVTANTGSDFGLRSNSELGADPVFHGIVFHENAAALAALDQKLAQGGHPHDADRYLAHALHYGNLSFARGLLARGARLHAMPIERVIGTGDSALIQDYLTAGAQQAWFWNHHCQLKWHEAVERAVARKRLDLAEQIWAHCGSAAAADRFLASAFRPVDTQGRCQFTQYHRPFIREVLAFYANKSTALEGLPEACRQLVGR